MQKLNQETLNHPRNDIIRLYGWKSFLQNNFKILFTCISVIAGFLFIIAFIPKISNLSANVLYISISVVLLLISIHVFKKSSTRHVFAPLVSFALFNLLGHITWIIHEFVLKTHPFPSVGDAFWITSYASLLLFLVFYIKTKHSTITKPMLMFGLMTSLLLLVPHFVFVQEVVDYSVLEITLVMTYPIMVAGAVFLVSSHVGNFIVDKDRFGLLFFLALVSLLVSHSFYVITADQFVNGNPIDLGWIVGYVIMSFALFRLNNKDRVDSESIFDSSFVNNNRSIDFFFKAIVPVIIVVLTTTFVILAIQHVIEHDNIEDLYLFFGIISMYTITIVILLKVLFQNIQKHNEMYDTIANQLRDELESKTEALIKKEKLASIGETASRLAHDIRNPLSLIKMSTTLLKNHQDVKYLEKHKKHYEIIDDAVDRINYQIENVLNFVRTKPLIKKPNSLSKIIQSAITNSNIPNNISVSLPKNDFVIPVDAIQFESVIVNLVTNSAQALDGSGEIKIELKKTNKCVSLSVIDSGPGISKENIGKIFEPLFTTKKSGTGLGLAGCKNIVKQHGGTISVQNNPTTFTITIPDNAASFVSRDEY